MSNDATWFKAKAYGWGWGLPTAWQGWAVYGAFALLMAYDVVAISPERHPAAFAAWAVGLAAIVVGICFVKGEKPSWRWGDRPDR